MARAVGIHWTFAPMVDVARDATARDWVIDPSTFDLWIGGDSTADLSTTFEVTVPAGYSE